MDGKEVTDLCNENQTTTSEIHYGEESTKQESHNKMKAKQLQGWRAKTGLKTTNKWLKVKKMKQ